jgi:hypothetical protein
VLHLSTEVSDLHGRRLTSEAQILLVYEKYGMIGIVACCVADADVHLPFFYFKEVHRGRAPVERLHFSSDKRAGFIEIMALRCFEWVTLPRVARAA